MKILYLIPARGGSKGLPGKNILDLGGKPLIAYSIDIAKQVLAEGDEICVSTDDDDIIQKVKSLGIEPPFIRPAELAADTSGTHEVILHALNFYEQERGTVFDVVMLLQPTSPFRTLRHITDVIELMGAHPDAEMVVSVRESKDNPYFNLFEETDNGYLKKSKAGNYTRRQDCPKVFAYNGSVYLIKVAAVKEKPLHSLEKIIKYRMDDPYNLDIDTWQDWNIAEQVIRKI
ncbi:acylneuraminate cytidylyltransferase family protein [Mucilaginibacter sp.]|uniref:acylneuraminate cytidylyltransferase family protein n=1 Tax=Mucilaginibacter sp. TaxID=1882438 RepID=UPI0025D75477|nr:acylneuraminate cytidylyltransferase family protein [Mucilaginibacter sp.]